MTGTFLTPYKDNNENIANLESKLIQLCGGEQNLSNSTIYQTLSAIAEKSETLQQLENLVTLALKPFEGVNNKHTARKIALKLLNDECEVLYMPFIGIAGEAITVFDGSAITLDKIQKVTVENIGQYLTLTNHDQLYYYPQKMSPGFKCLVHEGDNIIAIDTNKDSQGFNLDLDLINQYLKTVYVFHHAPQFLTLPIESLQEVLVADDAEALFDMFLKLYVENVSPEIINDFIAYTGNLFTAQQWQRICIQYANSDQEMFAFILSHLETHYKQSKSSIIASLFADEGFQQSDFAKHILNSANVNLVAIDSHKGSGNAYEQAGAYYFSQEKRKLLGLNDNENKLTEKEIAEAQNKLSKGNIFNHTSQKLESIAEGFKIKKLKNGTYSKRGKRGTERRVVDMLNGITDYLKQDNRSVDQLVDILNEYLRQEKINKNNANFLTAFLNNTYKFINKIEGLIVTINKQKAFIRRVLTQLNEENTYLLLSNPEIYAQLGAREFKVIFSKPHTFKITELVINHYGKLLFKPFEMQSGKIVTFDTLAELYDLELKNLDLDRQNKIRFDLGLPLNIPEGVVYSGVNYVSNIKLPADHNYQFESNDIAACESFLKQEYSSVLLNRQGDSKALNANCYFHIIPAQKAHLLSENSTPNEEEVLYFTQYKEMLFNFVEHYSKPGHQKDKPVVLCGALHYGGNHYIPFFLYPSTNNNHVSIAFADPSANDYIPIDGAEITGKDKANANLQKIFRNIFAEKNIKVDFTHVDITLQFRERDCGPNTMSVMEDALKSSTTDKPLIQVNNNKLLFNELALSRNGNRHRYIDYHRNAFFYTEEFVTACYQDRCRWNDILKNIQQTHFLDIEKTPNGISETIELTLEYNYQENIEQQDNQDIMGDHASIISALLFELHDFQDNNFMDDIKQKFTQTLALPTPAELVKYANLLRNSVKNNENNAFALQQVLDNSKLSLEKLIEQVLTENLRNSYVDAIQNEFNQILTTLLIQNVDYQLTADELTHRIIRENHKLSQFYTKVDVKNQEDLRHQWCSKVATRLEAAKLAHATKQILDYAQNNFINYLTFHDIDSEKFVANCLENFAYNSPISQDVAYLYTREDNVQKDVKDQLNRKLSTLIDNHISTLYLQYYRFLMVNIYSDDFLTRFYREGSFILFEDNNSLIHSNLLQHNCSDYFLNYAFLKFNQRFNADLYQYLQLATSTEINSLIFSDEFMQALCELDSEYLLSRKHIGIEQFTKEMLAMLQTFNPSLSPSPLPYILVWNEFIPDIHQYIMDLIERDVRPKLDEALDIKFTAIISQIVSYLIQQQIQIRENFDFDIALSYVIDKNLFHLSLTDLDYLNLRKERISGEFNEQITKLDHIYTDLEIIQKMINKLSYQDLAVATELNAIDCVSDILSNNSNALAVIQKTIEQVNSIKEQLIKLIQAQMRYNLKREDGLRRNHLLRQSLLTLTGRRTYTTKKREVKSYSYLLLNGQTVREIDTYLANATGLLPITPCQERACLLNLADIKNVEKIDTNKNPYSFVEHSLTRDTICNILQSWYKFYFTSEGESLFINALNNFISEHDAVDFFDLPRLRKMIEHFFNQSNLKEGEKAVLYHLMMTKEYQLSPTLSEAYLKRLFAIYNGDVKPDLQKALLHKDSTVPMGAFKLFGKHSVKKFFATPEIIKNLNRVLDDSTLGFANASDTISFNKIQAMVNLIRNHYRAVIAKNNNYLFEKMDNPTDKLLYNLLKLFAKHIRSHKERQANIFHWLVPDYFSERPIDYHYPQSYCDSQNSVLDEEDKIIREKTQIEDIPFENAVSLPTDNIEGYIVDITWITNTYLEQGTFIHPYTQKQLSQDELQHILAYRSPKVMELEQAWLDRQKLAGKIANENLGEKHVNILIEFCKNGFFVSGMRSYYSNNQNKSLANALQKLRTDIAKLPENEQTLMWNYPIQKITQGRITETISLEQQLKRNESVTVLIQDIATTIYAYNPKAMDQLNKSLKDCVLQYVNDITHLEYNTAYDLETNVNSMYEKLTGLRDVLADDTKQSPDDINFYQALVNYYQSAEQVAQVQPPAKRLSR